MIEAWRVVESIPRYEVSNLGRVRLRWERKLVKIQTDPRGILKVNTCYNGVQASRTIARLVGEAWCPRFKAELRALHKDGDRSNCSALNLKWVIQSKVTGLPFSRNPKPITK